MKKWKLINQYLTASISLALWKSAVHLILSLELWRCNLLTCDQEFSLPGQSPPPRHCTARSPSVPDSSTKQKNTFRIFVCLYSVFVFIILKKHYSTNPVWSVWNTHSCAHEYLWHKVSNKGPSSVCTFDVRSLWNMPLLWRYSSPLAISRLRFILTDQDRNTSLFNSCSRLPPLMYCNTHTEVKHWGHLL